MAWSIWSSSALDRVAANGDVCNKIGTYLMALAAHDNAVPFAVALPSPTRLIFRFPTAAKFRSSSAAWTRSRLRPGDTADGRIETVRVVSEGSPVANYAFDVTPARLISGLITERGVLEADRGALARAFPERVRPGGKTL